MAQVSLIQNRDGIHLLVSHPYLPITVQKKLNWKNARIEEGRIAITIEGLGLLIIPAENSSIYSHLIRLRGQMDEQIQTLNRLYTQKDETD